MQEVSDGPAWLATHMGYRLVADCTLDDCVDVGEQFDAILLPGGMPGAERLRDCAALQAAALAQRERGALVGAICAAPAVALAEWGILTADTPATAHPAFSDHLPNASQASTRVVCTGDGVITSRGPGTAFEFALAVVEELCGAEVAADVAVPMVLHDSWRAR